MKRYTTGYVMMPGFRPADIVGTHAVLGPHPLDKSLFIAPTLEPVLGKSGMTLIPNATFDDCPELDVLVIGDLPETAQQDPALLHFLKTRIPGAQFVIGVSGGVVALARTGLMDGVQATSDRAHLDQLAQFGLSASHRGKPVESGKFITAGPSTGMIEAAFLVQENLRGKGLAKFLELNLEYDPKTQFEHLAKQRDCPVETSNQGGLNIVVVAPDLIYLPDIMGAVDVLGSLPDAQVHFASHTLAPSRGLLSPTLTPTCTFDTCPQADVLVIGATGPNTLSDADLLAFVRRQDKTARAMISVCAGSLVFGAAGLLDGVRATSNFHHTNLLRRFGAKPSHKAVERDGKYFSAGPAIGSYEIALQVAAEIYGSHVAHDLEVNLLEYSPNPRNGVGSPEKAGRVMSTLSKALLAPSVPIYGLAGKLGQKRLTN